MMKWMSIAAVATLVIASPATARWRVAEGRHFTVYSELPAPALKTFAETIERYDATLRLLSGAPDTAGPASRVTIFQVKDADALHRVLGRGSGMIGGIYFPRAGASVAMTPAADVGGGWYDVGPTMSSRAILLHEYAHHFMYFNGPAVYPHWYSEGFAEFAGATGFGKDGSITIGGGAMYRGPALSGGSVSVRRLVYNDKTIAPVDLGEFYARSWGLTHYLTFAAERKGQLDTYLRLVAAGTPAPKAADQAFGDIAALERDAQGYMRGRQIPGLRLAATAVPIAKVDVHELSDGADAMLPVRIISWRGVDAIQAKALLPQARSTAARFPADAMVQVALAEAEFDAGNPAAARAAADRAIASDPRSGAAMVYRGRAALAEAVARKAPADDPAWAEARGWLIKANRIDPADPVPLMYNYRSYADAGQAPTANARIGLYEAARLAPQDRELQMDAARSYLAGGDIASARGRLQRAAVDVHGGSDGRYAAVWAALDKKDAPAALKALDEAKAKMEAEAKAAAKRG